MRATPNCATSSLSDGRRCPATQEPSWILCVMKALTCSYSAIAGKAEFAAARDSPPVPLGTDVRWSAALRRLAAVMASSCEGGSVLGRSHGFRAYFLGEARL